MEQLAEALAKKEHVVIKPSGQYALNKVGLSTQVPMRLVFLTTGNSKEFRLARMRLYSSQLPPKNYR